MQKYNTIFLVCFRTRVGATPKFSRPAAAAITTESRDTYVRVKHFEHFYCSFLQDFSNCVVENAMNLDAKYTLKIIQPHVNEIQLCQARCRRVWCSLAHCSAL